MTRKQAVLQAIDILSQDAGNKELVMKLREIAIELPLSHWTKESILDSIESYIVEHDNTLPLAVNLTSKNNLPSCTVIADKFGIASMDIFFKKFFPCFGRQEKGSSPYQFKSSEYFINVFKNNYARIQSEEKLKKVSRSTYDKYKEKNTPHTATIIKNCDCNSYEDLLVLCGYKKAKEEIEATISVSYNDTEGQALELRALLQEMDKE